MAKSSPLESAQKFIEDALGRSLNVYEENILRHWSREEGIDESRLIAILWQYLARHAAIELQALPHIRYVAPGIVTLGMATPGKRMQRPAVEYEDREGRHAYRIIGLQPNFIRRNPHSRDDRYVYSHSPQVSWETARDPRFEWAHPMGATWLVHIYTCEQYDDLYRYDPENKPKTYGCLTFNKTGW